MALARALQGGVALHRRSNARSRLLPQEIPGIEVTAVTSMVLKNKAATQVEKVRNIDAVMALIPI